MVVWGGGDENGVLVNTGGRYDPHTNSWMPTSTNSAPSVRQSHTAIWTGSKMVVWGGESYNGDENTGGRYCAGFPSPPWPRPSRPPRFAANDPE
jgi:hypothetical protein